MNIHHFEDSFAAVAHVLHKSKQYDEEMYYASVILHESNSQDQTDYDDREELFQDAFSLVGELEDITGTIYLMSDGTNTLLRYDDNKEYVDEVANAHFENGGDREIEVEDKNSYFEKHSPFKRKIDSKVNCLHCDAVYPLIDYKVVKEAYGEFIYCKYWPDCDGTIMDMIKTKKKDRKPKNIFDKKNEVPLETKDEIKLTGNEGIVLIEYKLDEDTDSFLFLKKNVYERYTKIIQKFVNNESFFDGIGVGLQINFGRIEYTDDFDDDDC